jgi:hypothetical protein
MGLFLKHTDEILRFDKLHLSRKQLLENAEQAKDIVLRYSDVYDRIERESFFGSGEVKRLADKTLAAFYEVEKQARHLAYSHTDTIPEDESLLEFNAALSQTIFQHANEL